MSATSWHRSPSPAPAATPIAAGLRARTSGTRTPRPRGGDRAVESAPRVGSMRKPIARLIAHREGGAP